MTRNATVISISTRGLFAGLLLASASSLAAQSENMRDREPDAMDVAATPVTDLNLNKDEIPELLLAAAKDPYASIANSDCDGIRLAILDLDGVLGPDYDLEDSEDDRLSEGRIAKRVVGSFIPFRGIIREVSGAADHKRDFEAAITAGLVRRAYLKGLGQASGCAYPARPAFTRVEIDDEVVEMEKVETGTTGQ